MPGLLILVVLLVLAAFVGLRGREVFYISVRDAELVVVRGYLPPPILNGFADVIREARVGCGSIRAVREGDHVRLVTVGISPGDEQRLRNILGCHVTLQRLSPTNGPGGAS